MKNPFDPTGLQTAPDEVHRAGMPGVFACLPAKSSTGRHWPRCSARCPSSPLSGRRSTTALGLRKLEVAGHGTFWGHDGTVWGAGAMFMTRADGQRQVSIAVNLMKWNQLDDNRKPQPHPIDDALRALYQFALCG